jgi:predicted transcriptional regulator of viral defense system
MNAKNVFKKELKVFQRAKGFLRTSQALKAGIPHWVLYRMMKEGVVEKVTRGLYRLEHPSEIPEIDLLTIAAKIPRCVICLTSALSFHQLSTQIPHQVDIALEKGAEAPRLNYPPLQVYRFSGEALTTGIEVHSLHGVNVQVYCPEKTIADCFKFRNRIGVETALEALKRYVEKGKPKIQELLRYSRICRVEKVLRPYLEATTARKAV